MSSNLLPRLSVSGQAAMSGQSIREEDRFRLDGQNGSFQDKEVHPRETLNTLVQAANPSASPQQLEALMALARQANGFSTNEIPGPRASVLIPTLDSGAARESSSTSKSSSPGAAAGVPEFFSDSYTQAMSSRQPSDFSAATASSLQDKGSFLESMARGPANLGEGLQSLAEKLSAFKSNTVASEVSSRLAAVPSEQRGAWAERMLAQGSMTSEQITSYVLDAEGGKPNVDTALARAASLLGSSNDPVLTKAVLQGLDQLVPGEGADKKDIQHLEDRLQALFAKGSVSEEAKARLVTALGEGAQNPNVRCAALVAFSQHVNELASDFKRLKSLDLDTPYRANGPTYGPGIDSEQVAERVAQLKAQRASLETSLPRAQAALGKLIAEPSGAPPADVQRPQTAAGQLSEYLSSYHREDQMVQGKEVARALFDPPSAAAMDSFKRLTEQVRSSSSSLDGEGLGFLVEAGRQALAVDPAAQEAQDSRVARTAMQIALAAGLGAAGVGLATFMGLSGAAVNQAFRAGFSRMGQETFNKMLHESSEGDPDQHWKSLVAEIDSALLRNLDVKDGFWRGIKKAEYLR